MRWLAQRYHRASRTQRWWLWGLALLLSAYIPLTIDSAGMRSRSSGTWLSWLWSLGIFAVVFVGALAIVVSEPAEARERALPPLWLSTLKYTALPFSVFCVYLLIYFPAMMNVDSYDQWQQITKYQFDAFFPLANTLLFWLPTLVWRSPAASMILQLTLLALVFGFSMAVVERWGVRTRWAWALTVLFVLHPVNGFFSVTYLKDTYYCAAVLWLTVITFLIFRSKGEGLTSRNTLVHLTLALASVALLRPNGLVPAFGTAALLLVAYRKTWRPLLISYAAFIAIFFGVNVGLAKVTHLSYVHNGFYSASPFIFDLGAILRSDLIRNPEPPPRQRKKRNQTQYEPRIVAPDRKLTQQQRETLQQFEDVDEWARLYQTNHLPYWHTKKDNWDLLDVPEKKAELVHVWFELARRYPGIILQHKISAGRVGWVTYSDRSGVSMEIWPPAPKDLQMPVPKFAPALTAAANKVLDAIQDDNKIRWFGAFPAVFTYACFFLIAVFAVKRASVLALLVGAPLFLNWLVTMAFCMAQNTRYFFASYLILPFVALIPWTLPKEPARTTTNVP